MKAHAAAEMKDPRQRIGPLPARREPRLQIEMRILLAPAHRRSTHPHARYCASVPCRRSRLFGELSIRNRSVSAHQFAGRHPTSGSKAAKTPAQAHGPSRERHLAQHHRRFAPVALGRFPGNPCHVSHPAARTQPPPSRRRSAPPPRSWPTSHRSGSSCSPSIA